MLKNSYITRCGGILLVPARTREHLEAHPEVGGFLEEVASLLELPRDGSFLAAEIDLGRIIGRSGAVEAEEVGLDEPATFALRVGRRKPSRVAVGAVGPEVSTFVVLAFASKEEVGTYVLITSYAGTLAPKEPWDAVPGREREESLTFWGRTALVWDPATCGAPFVSTWRQVIEG